MADTSPPGIDPGPIDDRQPDPGPLPTHRTRHRWRPPRRATVIGSSTVIALLAVAGLGALTNDDGAGDGTTLQAVDGSSTTITTAVTPSNSSTTSTPGGATEGPTSTDQTTNRATLSTTAATTSDPSDGELDGTASTPTTTAAETAGSSPADPADPADSAATATATPTVDLDALAAFRERLASIQLDPTRLTNTDVADFAETLCVIAAVENAPGYAAFRTDLATEQARTSSLTADELADVIDAAVTAFCPDDAARLGLSA
ncbi:MAG: hypothetical protein AAGA93_25405 [Actinomycetota bacterium]